MTTLAPSFLIGSSSYLQVTRTSITSRTSSNFGQIGPRSAELAALARLKDCCIMLYNISATSGSIVTKFKLNHNLGGGKAALGFGLDRIGTLVSMETDSSHRVIMGKML